MRAPTPTAAAELAVPVRAELLVQTLDFQRRMLNTFSRGVEQRRRHLAQLARVLPRAEQLFAVPRQRLDIAGDKLGKSLFGNLQKHGTRLAKTAALLRAKAIKDRIAIGRERIKGLYDRALRAEKARMTRRNQAVVALGRVLDGISYRAVLERGFALVRGEDGQVRRRAAALKPGEALTLSFADGETPAIAGGSAKTKAKKTPTDQGSLF
jgi:exodeoxyribonuclease VII large subunit